MLDVLRWYVVVQLFGLAAIPLTARAFRNLPDRGYAFARPLGILVVSIALWFGSTFGLWSNSGATVAILLLAIASIGWFGMPSTVRMVSDLWQQKRTHILVVEALFLLAFLVWAYCRAYFPNIEATEKPMEFGFLNGIIRSQRFPPADPWLAGHSISYYYLGYVIVAAITELSGVIPAVAFNLAIATLFALTVTGSFALGYALVSGLRSTGVVRRKDDPEPESPSDKRTWIGGGLAAIFVATLGNLEGFLEILHAHGVGTVDFWKGLAIWHLGAPIVSDRWFPTDAQDNWWWFRATRVVLDYPLGTPPPDGYNTITEFPFFSFLLGDLHPHVIALPFAFVCLGFALSFLREPDQIQFGRWRDYAFELGFVALVFGSMFLLNAWDMLTYLFVLVCAFAARRFLGRPVFDFRWLRDTAAFGFGALILAVGVYWPFYLTFRSQATGLLGVVKLHSHLSYFLLYWAPFLFLVASLVVAELALGWSPLPGGLLGRAGPRWTNGPLVWIAVVVVAIGSLFLDAPALALVIPIGVASIILILRYLSGETVPVDIVIQQSIKDVPTLTAAREDRGAAVAGGAIPASIAIEHVFALILVFVAMLLLLGTEVFYIKDSFDNRMNTVFKLYFQAWVMLAIVGGYAIVALGEAAFPRRVAYDNDHESLLPRAAKASAPMTRFGFFGWLLVAAAIVGAAFIYVPAAVESRSNGFSNEATLNGLTYFQRSQGDDAAAIAWLNQHVAGTPTLVEATGGSYSAFGEVAWMTGIPTLLGWDFHEIQWHGSSVVSIEDERKRDIDLIYRSTDTRATQDLLTRYGVTYVYVGPMERQVYGQAPAGLGKFGKFMDAVYSNPGVTIYKARGTD